MSGQWVDLADGAPFPDRMQGEWIGPSGESIVTVEGRNLAYLGHVIPVGRLATLDEDGTFALKNEAPYVSPVTGYWGEETLSMLWFNPNDDTLNFHGIGDHGTAVRQPSNGTIPPC